MLGLLFYELWSRDEYGGKGVKYGLSYPRLSSTYVRLDSKQTGTQVFAIGVRGPASFGFSQHEETSF